MHGAVVDKIRQSFFDEATGPWMKERGHPASWREEIGHRRLRPDAWSYAVFLPIDAVRARAVAKRPWHSLAFPYESTFCMGLLYGRAGRLTALFGDLEAHPPPPGRRVRALLGIPLARAGSCH